MLNHLTTENRNEKTMNLDNMSTEEFLTIMNEEDAKVAYHIEVKIPQVIASVNKIVASFKSGGRLIYIGAGTSGRLGLLDAVECPPTFGSDPNEVIGMIAGGKDSFIKDVEGAEDKEDLRETDLLSIDLNRIDIVVGIAASGRTPYVKGGLKYANYVGAVTVDVNNNVSSAIGKISSPQIEVDPGPE